MTLHMKIPSRRFTRFYRYPQVFSPRALFPVNEPRLYAWDPRVDIRHEDGRVLYSIDVAAAKPEDLDVTVDDGVVTIKGKLQLERGIDREGYNLRETSISSFTRCLPLDRGADWKRTEASYEDGVLEVTIPVSEATSRHIEIQSDEGNPSGE